MLRKDEILELLEIFQSIEKKWNVIQDSCEKETSQLSKIVHQLVLDGEKIDEISIAKSDHNFTKLKQEEFLSEENGTYSLPSENALPLVFQILEEVIRKALKDGPDKLAKELDSISHKLIFLNLDDDYASILLIYLHNQKNLDVFKLVQNTIEAEGRGIFSVYHYFCYALPFLKVKDFTEFCNSITNIRAAVSRDMTNGFIFTAIKDFAELNPSVSEELFSFIKKKGKGEWAFLLNSIILGLGENHFVQSFNKSCELLKNTVKEFQEAGIISLGYLNYKNQAKKFVEKAVDELERIFRLDDPHFNSRLARTYGVLRKFNDEALNHFFSLSATDIPEVQYSVSESLINSSNEIPSNKTLKKAFFNLSFTRSKHINIVDHVDIILSELVENDVDLVIQFINEWQKNRIEGEVDKENNLPKLFNSTFNKLIEVRFEEIKKIVTRWLNTSDRSLLLECQYITSELRLRNHEEDTVIELSSDELRRIPIKNCLGTVEKILGYVLDGRDQCSLVYSILKHPKCNAQLESIVLSAFEKRISYNYPGLTRKFLSGKKKEADGHKKRVAEKVISLIDDRIEERKKLQYLDEFRIPNERKKDYLKAKGKFYGDIYEESQRKSIVSQIAKKVPLKYGNKWFMETNKVIQKPTPLSSISNTVELPKGEFTDPILEQMLRVKFRS